MPDPFSYGVVIGARTVNITGNFENDGNLSLVGGAHFNVTGNFSSTQNLWLDVFDNYQAVTIPGFPPSDEGAISSDLTVMGNLTLSSTNDFFEFIQSPDIISKAIVHGTATLGGNLSIIFSLDDTTAAEAGGVFTILSSDHPIAGQFANVASGGRLSAYLYEEAPDFKTPAGNFRVDYSGNNLTLSDYQPVPQLTGAVSRKAHGSAGAFDIDLPLEGAPGIECRDGRGSYTLVFSFNKNIVSGSAAVTAGSGSVAGAPLLSADTMTVNLTGVADVQELSVTLSGVTDAVGQVMADTAVPLKILIGDTTGDSSVGSSDIAQTKSAAGSALNATNFRNDINLSGAVNTSDIGLVKSKSGHSLPNTTVPPAKSAVERRSIQRGERSARSSRHYRVSRPRDAARID